MFKNKNSTNENITVKWLIDDYILKNSYHERLDHVLERNNIEYKVRQYIPFEREPEELPFNNGENVVVYGSVEFVNFWTRNTNYVPCSYYNERELCCSFYMSKLSEFNDQFLNSECVFMPFGKFITDYQRVYEMFGTNVLFIRPDNGNKSFSGKMVHKGDINHEHNAMKNLEHIDDSELIMISYCKNINNEYRYFIVNGEIVGKTQYMLNGKLFMDEFTDATCDHLANDISKNDRQLDIAYVCDITVDNSDHEPKIVEFNSINSSGFYSADIDSIVIKLSKAAMEEFEGELSKVSL